MQAIIIVAVVGTILTIVILAIVAARRAAKKRTEALAAVAAANDMAFSAEQDEALWVRLGGFAYFGQGRSRKMFNVISAKSGLANVHIFDYRFTTSSGENSSTHYRSIVAVESDTLDIPAFSLSPENFFHSIAAAFGFDDIDFDDDPGFSKMFVLKGQNEDAIRALFDREMRAYFVQHKGIQVEATGGLYIYVKGVRRKKPGEIRDYMKEAFAVYEVLANRLRRN